MKEGDEGREGRFYMMDGWMDGATDSVVGADW